MEQKYSIWQQHEVEWKFKAAEHENSQIQIPQIVHLLKYSMNIE